jgi:formate hydrogenlyase subunit 3/multisubunit Na+/H+ antiporter MnhD subunit
MAVIAGLWCVAALLGIAITAVPIGRAKSGSTIVYAASLVASIAALANALALLMSGDAAPSLVLPLGLPWVGAHFRVDVLAAFFLIVVNLGGAMASLYAIGYGRHEASPRRILPFFPAFLAAMNLVVMADDVFSFLFTWEFMSLSSWALVVAHHRERDNLRAGYVYLIMASFGTLALLLALGLLAGPLGAYGFDQIRHTHPALPLATLVLVLTILGAGSKAGLVPLHVWLPLAHPAAPSHVSALMSGVMTKVAVYGFIRIVFDLVGPTSWGGSMAVLAVGGITAAVGVLQALLERDIKRVLAYSSVENIGIVFIGLGLALAFRSAGMHAAAALALTASLFHALNHSLFKSLLFFGAGAILTATGERDMDRLGGMIHRMPRTAFVMLIGSMAIAALPPLNGFVSEWLTFQAILISPELPEWGLRVASLAVAALLALAAALAAACFVRAFGISFLGRPRSDAAARAGEVDRFSLVAMFLLAALCLLAGVLPGFVIDALAPVTRLIVDGEMPAQSALSWLTIAPIAASRSSYNGFLVFVFMLASASLTAFVIHRLASRKLRRSAAWDCGYPEPNAFTQYSAISFAQPIRRVFGTVLFRAQERVEMPAPGSAQPATLRVELRDLVWEGIYAPVVIAVSFAADRLNHLQFLTIRRYLSLVFAALVLLLLARALWE